MASRVLGDAKCLLDSALMFEGFDVVAMRDGFGVAQRVISNTIIVNNLQF